MGETFPFFGTPRPDLCSYRIWLSVHPTVDVQRFHRHLLAPSSGTSALSKLDARIPGEDGEYL